MLQCHHKNTCFIEDLYNLLLLRLSEIDIFIGICLSVFFLSEGDWMSSNVASEIAYMNPAQSIPILKET